jgi:hypothetical protein
LKAGMKSKTKGLSQDRLSKAADVSVGDLLK